MNIIQSNTSNPFFNLATEEYLFKNKTEEYFFIYRNNPSIIIGKHQNAYAEANYKEIIKSEVPLIRRLSGGGTVYHDTGNINFSFIVNRKGQNLIDFKKHMQPIYNLLIDMGLNVEFSKRNDLFIGDGKISGNAEHIFKNRVLHHGTLLFNSNLKFLKSLLTVNNELFEGKAIQSVRSKVDNITNYLKKKISVEQFTQQILQKIKSENSDCNTINLNVKNEKKIVRLVNEKYKTWEWNFAYSPNFKFRKTIYNKTNFFTAFLSIEKGIIVNIDFKTDFISEYDLIILKEKLKGKKYEYVTLHNLINKQTKANSLKMDVFDSFF